MQTTEKSIKKAIEAGEAINLKRANLTGIDLSRQNLSGANFWCSNLRDSEFYKADLSGSNLRGACLVNANLIGVNLTGADLTGADLTGAILENAIFTDANLSDVTLTRAVLQDAFISDESLDQVKFSGVADDLFLVLFRAIPEISTLKQALHDGEIDGLSYLPYESDYYCLSGTLERSAEASGRSTAGILECRDSCRPIERFFLSIQPGDTPATSWYVRTVLGWIDQFEQLLEKPFGRG